MRPNSTEVRAKQEAKRTARKVIAKAIQTNRNQKHVPEDVRAAREATNEARRQVKFGSPEVRSLVEVVALQPTAKVRTPRQLERDEKKSKAAKLNLLSKTLPAPKPKAKRASRPNTVAKKARKVRRAAARAAAVV